MDKYLVVASGHISTFNDQIQALKHASRLELANHIVSVYKSTTLSSVGEVLILIYKTGMK